MTTPEEVQAEVERRLGDPTVCKACMGDKVFHHLPRDGEELKPEIQCPDCVDGADPAWALALWTKECLHYGYETPEVVKSCACHGTRRVYLLGDEVRQPCSVEECRRNQGYVTSGGLVLEKHETCHGHGFTPTEDAMALMRALADGGYFLSSSPMTLGITIWNEDNHAHGTADGISIASLRLAAVRALKGSE